MSSEAWASNGRMRNADGQPVVPSNPDGHVDAACWAQLVDAWPEGELQAQLDRIEAKLAAASSLMVSIDPVDPVDALGSILVDQDTASVDTTGGSTYDIANRWAAFTDDELEALVVAMDWGRNPSETFGWDPISAEVQAELERRKP